MIHQRTDLPPAVYPDDPWAITEEAFTPRFLYLMETIFALSNGHIGVRGTVDEGSPVHIHGTFMNGYHETWPIVHPESAYGFATTGQTIVNIPDSTTIEVTVDGEPFELSEVDLLAYRRRLDFREGVLERTAQWTTESGVTVDLHTRRLVSLHRREVIATLLTLEVDRPAAVSIRSRVINRQDMESESSIPDDDPRRAQTFRERVLVAEAATLDGARYTQAWSTSRSGLGLIVGVDHRCDPPSQPVDVQRDAEDFAMTFSFQLEPGVPMTMEKTTTYRRTSPQDLPEDRLAVERTLDEAAGAFDTLAAEQARALAEFWDRADVVVEAGPEIQRAIRWSLFQLHQASALIENSSIPAKGLSGQAYDGNYFWDTEIYVMPFLVFTNPERAAEILRFRYSLLDAARIRADVLGHRGAMYPWRTISGEEASAYFPAGTAQYHINADIIYALKKYVEVTRDEELLWEMGVEMAVETARMWADLGFFRGNRYHIHGVTGPDEYSALVNNNAYTNAMARMNLRFAADCVVRMAERRPEQWHKLAERLGVGKDEPVDWRMAADSMFIPFDSALGITEQDDAFLDQERWPFDEVPVSKYPLLLHFHPLTIYRYQVLKQADVVLADFLLGDEFASDLKRANYDYYDPLTTGDSSLSASVQAIMAAEIGYMDDAVRHFENALFVDLADLAGNTTDGVHMASAGGTWMALVYGFAGMRDTRGDLSFDPALPRAWRRVAFPLRVRGSRLDVDLTRDTLRLSARERSLEVHVRGTSYVVEPGVPLSIPV